MEKESYSVIFKALKAEDNLVLYIPIDLLKGKVNVEGEFVSKNKKAIFTHITNNPKEYGYAYNNTVDELLKKYYYLPFMLQKKLVLNYMQSFNYIFGYDKNSNKPIIIIQDLCSDNYCFLSDNYVEKFINPNFNIVEDSFNIKDNYEYIIKKVVQNEENIKKILTIIWKRKNNYLSENEKNILIDGNDIDTKNKIFTCLEEISQIPVIFTSITKKNNNQLHGKEIESLLEEILKKTNGNYSKAINSILVINDLDKIKYNNSSDYQAITAVQNNLIELLQGGKYIVNYNNQKVLFDTSKLIIVCFSNFNEYKTVNKIGFLNDDKDLKISKRSSLVDSGLSAVLCESFQTIMEISKNKDNIDEEIYNNNGQILIDMKRILENYGVKLELDESLEEIIFNNTNISNEIINEILSLPLFDIASNPYGYEKLIISNETIKDNRKYTLIRKK